MDVLINMVYKQKLRFNILRDNIDSIMEDLFIENYNYQVSSIVTFIDIINVSVIGIIFHIRYYFIKLKNVVIYLSDL